MKKVLDKGFVDLIDVMGSDASIVQAARVSYGAGTKKVSEDKGLIRYLMRHGHTTPFEMSVMKFHIKMPMDTHRQQIRHRTASVNEYSTRYSKAIEDMMETEPGAWRLQDGGNKQGSSGFVTEFPKSALSFNSTPGEELSAQEKAFQDAARDLYETRLAYGVAREQARKDLPLCNYTEYYWKMDLHNLFHYLKLRLDSHAQFEIRQYAIAIAEYVKEKFPWSYEAFEDYRLNAISLSARDIKMILAINGIKDRSSWSDFGWLKKDPKTGKLPPNRERSEFESKCEKLGINFKEMYEINRRNT